MRYFKTLICTILLFLVCIHPSSGQDESFETVTVAQFGKHPLLLYLPFYIAMENGYFSAQGLEIELIFAGNGDQTFATVISGDADFGMADPVFTAIAHEKGFEAKVVAMMITSLGISGYTQNPDIPIIQDIQQLNGLRVGSFPAPSTGYTLLADIKKKHNLDRMEIVEAAIGGQVGLVEADRADIAIDMEPTVSIVEDKGHRIVFDMTPFTPRQAITGITVTQETIRDRPHTVQKLVTGLQNAMNTLHGEQGRTTAIEVARKLFPDLENHIIEAAVDRMLKYEIYPHSVVVDDQLWQRSLQMRLDSGELKTPQETRISVDNHFAQKAILSE